MVGPSAAAAEVLSAPVLAAMSAVMVEGQRIVVDFEEAGSTFGADRRGAWAWVPRQSDTEPVADVLGTEVEEEWRERSLEMVPADVAVEGQEGGEAHCRISTCDYSAAAGLAAIVAEWESHIGWQGVRHPAVEEVEEDRLFSRPVGSALGAEVVVEGRRSMQEATVQSSVVGQLAPVVEEERVEEWERLVVGPREVAAGPGLLRRREAPSRRHLGARPRSQIGWISAHSLGQLRRVQKGVVLLI